MTTARSASRRRSSVGTSGFTTSRRTSRSPRRCTRSTRASRSIRSSRTRTRSRGSERAFSYRANLMILSDHASTHVDAFTHFDPDPEAATIDQMPLDLFCGEAVCLDLSHLAPRAGITVADLEAALANGRPRAYGRENRAALHRAFQAHKRQPRTTSPSSPASSRVSALADRAGRQAVRKPGDERRRPRPVHVPGPPGLPRARRQPYRKHRPARCGRRKAFYLFAFPLKIVPGTGSPMRLVAALPED